MSHDEHFLERLARLDDLDTSFAFRLYRHPALVKRLLELAAPPGASRVAIALHRAPDGPLVVVERDGHFVTCLAAGMRTDLPTIRRAVVDQHLEADAAFARLVRFAKEKADDATLDNPLINDIASLSFDRHVTAEMVSRTYPWLPVFEQHATKEIGDKLERWQRAWAGVRDAVRLREKHHPDALRMWKAAYRLGSVSMQQVDAVRRMFLEIEPNHGNDGGRLYVAAIAATTGRFGTVLRGLWAHGQLGAVLETAAHASARSNASSFDRWVAGSTLAVIALKNPDLKARAELTLRHVRDDPATDDYTRRHYRKLHRVIEHPREAMERHLDWARAFVAERFPPLGELDATDTLTLSLEDPRVCFGAEADDRLSDALVFVAAADAPQMFPRDALVARMPPVTELAEALDYVERMRAQRRKERAEEPPPPPTPGRNEPCHCGSGKKFKKCHGG